MTNMIHIIMSDYINGYYQRSGVFSCSANSQSARDYELKRIHSSSMLIWLKVLFDTNIKVKDKLYTSPLSGLLVAI